MRPTFRTLVLVLPLVALTACSGETTSPLTDSTPATETSSPTASDDDPTEGAAPAEGTTEVDIDDFRFAPETITVTAGTEVTWTNRDATRHTVTAGSEEEPAPDDFDLEVEGVDDTVSTTFDEPGTYPYFCELHPFMTATVEVTEA